ncbi:MAG: archease [Thermofilum sp.]|jgi:SHS2 domain-containing protein|nr:archease [Thermofilum sp.]
MSSEVGFQLLPHTADVIVRAVGRTLEEAFANAALGMFDVMTNLASVAPKEKRSISVDGFDLENLLYNFLERLLVIFDQEQFLVSKIDELAIKPHPGGYSLSAVVLGETYSPDRHESRVLVKAITYHQMKIYREGDLYIIEYTPDI